ncbi:hypothetical protein P308_30235 [Pseudomonas piscis]|nr:hypothetical protein P308_30235 [Pseudomonas piscis]
MLQLQASAAQGFAQAPAASNWPWTGAEVLPAARDGFRLRARPAWLAIWFRVLARGAAGRL